MPLNGSDKGVGCGRNCVVWGLGWDGVTQRLAFLCTWFVVMANRAFPSKYNSATPMIFVYAVHKNHPRGLTFHATPVSIAVIKILRGEWIYVVYIPGYRSLLLGIQGRN